MVKVYSHKQDKKQKLKRIHREIIDLHLEDIGFFINKLYASVNTDDICAFCKKKSKYVRVVIDDMKKVYVFKICRPCLIKK